MSKSLIYMANTNSQTISTGSAVNFGNIIRRYGCNCSSNGTNPVVDGTGYYDIDVNVTLTGTAGTIVLTLYQDGTAITGATQSATIVADTTYSFNIPAIIRNKKCCDSTNITCVITGSTATISNASIKVVKE